MTGPSPQTDPYLLVRGYDTCSRSSCQHQRRWHTPCTARLGEQDQLGRCGCPAFLDVQAVQASLLAADSQQQAAQTATQAQLSSHAAQPDHKTLVPKPTLLEAAPAVADNLGDVAQDSEPVATPQVLAPDGSVVTPTPDDAVAQDTPPAAAEEAAAPAQPKATRTTRKTRR